MTACHRQASRTRTVERRGAPLVWQQLAEEWTALRTSAGYAAAFQGWVTDEPALAGLATLDDLVDVVADRTRPDAADRILAVLARRAAAGGDDDRIAARLLLQLLLPGTRALARRLFWFSDAEERAAAALAAVVQEIRLYPWRRRPAKIAANVLRDAYMRLRRDEVRRRRVDDAAELLADDQVVAVEEPSAGVELLELLAWAVHTGVLDRADASLIAATRIGDVPIEELAAAAGVQPGALLRRRQRREQRFAVSVRAALAG
jgi:hypothetical protein